MTSILKFALSFAASIPFLPALGGVFTNRRASTFPLCSWADIALNTSDVFFRFIHRMAPGTQVLRDRSGRFSGFLQSRNK